MPRTFPVTIERDGKTYHGTYVVERGMITVRCTGGSKTTQVGNMPVEVLARLLLSELVHQGKA